MSSTDLEDFWSDSLLVMILFIWMIIVTVIVIIFAICWCWLLHKRKQERHLAEREQYYREQTLLDFNSKPEVNVNVAPFPPPPPPSDLRSGSISEQPPPEWFNSMKEDDYKDYQIDTIDRTGKPAPLAISQQDGNFNYETRSLPRSTGQLTAYSNGGQFAYDNVVVVPSDSSLHQSQPNLHVIHEY